MPFLSSFLWFLSLGYLLSGIAAFALRRIWDGAELQPSGIPQKIRRMAAAGLLLAAGPFVLTQEIIRAQNAGEWPDSYLAGGYLLAGAWSSILGFALAQVL
jgi:hypothetical protein